MYKNILAVLNGCWNQSTCIVDLSYLALSSRHQYMTETVRKENELNDIDIPIGTLYESFIDWCIIFRSAFYGQ